MEDLKKESEAFDTLRPGEDMVGLAAAFQIAQEEYRPGQGKKK
jgi:small subunit ribosomal protein S1